MASENTKKSCGLFPSAFLEQTAPVRKQNLFPINAETTLNVSREGHGNLDWLQNKSYILVEETTSPKDELADSSPRIAVAASGERQEEVVAVSQSSKCEADDVPQAGVASLKRSCSVSDSDESERGESVQKHCHKKKKKKKEKEKKHKKDKKRHKHKRTGAVSPSSDSLERIKDPCVFSIAPKALEEVNAVDQVFMVDRKCEKSLWNYESVYQGHISKYFRIAHSCLGNTNIILHKEKGIQKSSVSRYYTKSCRKEIKAKGSYVTSKDYKENSTPQYISIKEKTAQAEESILSKHASENAKSSLLGASSSTHSQEKVAVAEQAKDSSGLELDETFERTAYYNRRLHNEPSNVKLWLEFVSFQDQLFQDSSYLAKSAATEGLQEGFQTQHACVEKKLAILKKAIEANPLSLELKVEKLHIQKDDLDSRSLAEEWDKLLSLHSSDEVLWRRYLKFQQSHLPNFTVGRIIEEYHRCFRCLNAIRHERNNDVKVDEHLEEEMIGILEQYCSFLKLTGFVERAVATCQALVEFNLFCPSSLNLVPTQECVTVFKTFWDSGVARFGELGAKGWATSMEDPQLPERQPFVHDNTEEEQEAILAQEELLSRKWLQIECLRQNTRWLPWQPDPSKGETEDDCEDLDRLVLFDDVAPVLFRVGQSGSCSRLVTHFVQFLGLVHQQSMEQPEFDQLNLVALHQVPARCFASLGLGVDSTWQPREEISQFLQQVLRQAAAYFTGWHRSFFTAQLLQMYVCKHGSVDLASLSDEAAKGLRKVGKGLLKETQNRNDLLLWNKYIRIEWALGRKKDALSMLRTALTMFTSSTSGGDHAAMMGLYSLYCTLAEISLNFSPIEFVPLSGRKSSPSADQKKEVVASFVCYMNSLKFHSDKSHTVTASQVLMTRRKFQHSLKELINDRLKLPEPFVKEHIVKHVHCFALFELCATGFDASVKVFDTAFQLCTLAFQEASSLKATKEMECLEKDLTLSLLSLLANYMSVETLPLGQIRSRLDTSLSRFPDSPLLLDQLVELESKSCLSWKLRRYFEIAAREPTSVFPALFEILAEMKRHQRVLLPKQETDDVKVLEGFSDTGTVHRVRAACERGLQHKVTQHCPLLWRLYIAFEAKYGKIGRAEGIFYRALQSCPWAKVLYLDGVELFGTTQLQTIVDLMIEKELRVQIPLEEVELLIESEPQEVPSDSREQPVPSGHSSVVL